MSRRLLTLAAFACLWPAVVSVAGGAVAIHLDRTSTYLVLGVGLALELAAVAWLRWGRFE